MFQENKGIGIPTPTISDEPIFLEDDGLCAGQHHRASPSSGRSDGNVRPCESHPPPGRRRALPERTAKATPSPNPPPAEAASPPGPRRQEKIDLVALDGLVELFARAHHSGRIFSDSGCILYRVLHFMNRRCLDMG